MKNLQLLLWKEIHVYGFLVFTLTRTMPAWVARGDVNNEGHIMRGLENAPQGIMDLRLGTHFGKSVLLVAVD